MAYVSTPIAWPSQLLNAGTIFGVLIDAAAEKAAFVFRVPKDGTLNSVGFLLGTVTQAPTNGLTVSFQDVSLTTGYPDGTADQYATVTTGLTSNTWVDVSSTGYMGSTGAGSGTKRSVTAGDILSIVIEYASFSASDSLNVAAVSGANGVYLYNSHYTAQYTAAWSKVGASPIFSLKYDDGSYAYIPCVHPVATMASTTVNTGTTPDEVGNIFQLPFACKASGAFFTADMDGDLDIVLYGSDGTTVLGSFSLDKDLRVGTSLQCGGGAFTQGEQILTANTDYRLVIKPTSGTNVTIYEETFPSTAVMAQMDGGSNLRHTTRTDAGAWTDTTTKRVMGLGLIISQIDIGSAGGGLPILGGSVVR